MSEGSTLIIHANATSQLSGFIGILLVLLQTVESCLSICTTGASADVRVRPSDSQTKRGQTQQRQLHHHGREEETRKNPTAPEVQLFDLLQQLERALPLPYR